MAKMSNKNSLCDMRTSTENHSFRPYLIEYYPQEHLVIQLEKKENISSGSNPLFWSPAGLSNSPSLQLLLLKAKRCERKYCFQGISISFDKVCHNHLHEMCLQNSYVRIIWILYPQSQMYLFSGLWKAELLAVDTYSLQCHSQSQSEYWCSPCNLKDIYIVFILVYSQVPL